MKLAFIEIDVSFCANTYGVLPCTASLTSSPPTGTKKCFNTPKTCQDRLNYIDAPVTLRFSEDVGPVPVDAIPCIRNINYTPARVSLGKDLGTRASLSVTFKDHPWPDTAGLGFDKYWAERPYDSFKQGSMWSKFRARQPFLRGKKLRWITGDDDQTLEEMETRHFYIDSFSHDASDGTFTIVAKDLLKFADDDRSQAPALSNGFLLFDITNVATSLTLVPGGVGEEYPASGYVAIGGKEIVSYAHELVPGNDADTVLLIHATGANGTTAFTDTSASPKTITVVGNTVMNDIFTKFGTGGIFFDGAGDSLTLADNIAWTFGSGDFTVDFWQCFRTLAATKHFFTHYTDANNRYFLSVSATGVLTFSVIAAGVTTVTMSSAAGVVADDDVIRHIAVTRSGNVWRIFVDGVQVATTTDSDAIPNYTSLFRIGGDNANGSSYDGWMWEFRVSKGVARWTSTFEPPIVAYQTSIDLLILNARGQFNTEASEHETNDRVQWVLIYDAQDSADILRDLFVTYAGFPEDTIPLASWKAETASFLSRLFSAVIAEPTGVNKLAAELVEDAALCLWWDELEELVRLRVLRTVPLDALQFNQDNYLKNSLSSKEQPNTQVTQIWRYFAKRNPLEGQEDPDNYRSVSATVDLQAETDYEVSVIHKIFSRWIPFGGRTIADKANELYISRFRDPPRLINFSTFRDGFTTPQLGQSYYVTGASFQDDTGVQVYVPAQITSLRPGPAQFDIEAEEMLIVNVDLTNRIIAIDVTTFDINLRELHDTLYPPPTDQDVIDGVTLLCTIDPNVTVGSTNADIPAFDIGDWPVGFPITLRISGRIAGAGGKGNAYTGAPNANGQKGGTALYTRKDIDLEVADGQIWAGGGGGGRGSSSFIISPNVSIRPGSGGGGGAGFVPGEGGIPASLNYNGTLYQGMPGNPGTQTTGGTGGTDYFFGGNGGGRGVAGTAGQGGGGSSAAGAGGAAGNAIDGVSFVNVVTGPGDIIGPQIN